jgi:hypothetical protein
MLIVVRSLVHSFWSMPPLDRACEDAMTLRSFSRNRALETLRHHQEASAPLVDRLGHDRGMELVQHLSPRKRLYHQQEPRQKVTLRHSIGTPRAVTGIGIPEGLENVAARKLAAVREGQGGEKRHFSEPIFQRAPCSNIVTSPIARRSHAIKDDSNG